MAEKRFMEAVAAKIGAKRRPAMKRKPGVAVMIAVGGPKGPPMAPEREDAPEASEEKGASLSKAEKIAALQEKIAALKAELALLEDEDEMDEVEDEAYQQDAEMEQDAEDEDEGEDED